MPASATASPTTACTVSDSPSSGTATNAVTAGTRFSSVLTCTVDRHRSNILEKLHMRDRVDLTRYAIRRGLIEP